MIKFIKYLHTIELLKNPSYEEVTHAIALCFCIIILISIAVFSLLQYF